MLLVIDNYDSFTYNLVQFFGELGEKAEVRRNDRITADEIAALAPTRIVISPGPCTPKESGVSRDVLATLSEHIPTLGVCLGHQCLGDVYGGEVIRGAAPVHGKTSAVHHTGRGLFEGVANPFRATRYHSLIVKRETLPETLQIEAWTKDGVIMALRHKTRPIWGVQFHPESILTQDGKKILDNFLKMTSAEGIKA